MMSAVDMFGVPPRRLGTWLLAFGVLGLVLTVVMMLGWLGGLVAIQDLDERLEAERVAAAESLNQAADLLDSTAGALEDSTASLGTVEEALDDAARLLDQLADATADLAADLDFTILGQQPLAGVAASFAEIANELAAFAAHTATLSGDLDALQPSLLAVADDLQAVEESVSALAERVETYSGVEQLVGLIRAYALLSALLAAWLAVLAAGCTWVGLQLRRGSPAAPTPSADTVSGGTTPTS